MQDHDLPQLRNGDWLMFTNAGAYTVAGACDFNGIEFTTPATVRVHAVAMSVAGAWSGSASGQGTRACSAHTAHGSLHSGGVSACCHPNGVVAACCHPNGVVATCCHPNGVVELMLSKSSEAWRGHQAMPICARWCSRAHAHMYSHAHVETHADTHMD